MPNIVRRPRPRRPNRRSNRPCDPGTHLTYEERCCIYSLSQHPGWSQRAIASTLQLPRSTVQSAIYALTRTSKKQQHRKRIPDQSSALATATSGSAINPPSSSYMTTTMPPGVQQSSSYYPTSATPEVPSITTSIPDGHYTQPPQSAVAPYSWDNVNSGEECNLSADGSHHRLASLSTERFDLPRFDPHQSANIGIPLLPDLPKLTPVEPRTIYPSSVNSTFPLSTPLHQATTPSVPSFNNS